MLKKFVVSLLSAALCASPTSAARWRQQPAPAPQPSQPAAQKPAVPEREQEETVRVGSNVVQVDVVVTDKTGRRVTGLAPEDFQLLDEGRPQRVDFFSAVEGSRVARTKNAGDAASPSSGAAAAASPPAAPSGGAGTSSLLRPYIGRHIALVVDDPGMSNENFLRSRQALAEYVNHKLTPNDMVALVSTGGRLASSQQFTNDRQRLLAAINRVGAQGRASLATDARIRISAAEAVRIDSGDEGVLDAVFRRVSSESLANQSTAAPAMGGGGGGASPEAEALRNQIRGLARGRVGELAAQSRTTLRTLSSLFEAMAELPGRKVVVLLSESFITLGGTTEDQTNELLKLIDAARRGGISVYALDAGGLRTNSTTASEYITGSALRARDISGNANFSDFENMSAARAVTTGTGGSLIANTNDIVGGMQRAVEDSSSYYVIGFTPAALDNKFHRLAVTVRGRPDLQVRTRRGYLAVNAETVRGTQTELAAALVSPIPLAELPVEVVASVVPQGGAQTVLVGFRVGRNYLSLPAPAAPDQTASYEVLAYIFAAGQEQPVGGVRKAVALDLSKPEERQRLSAAGFVYVPQPFQLGPGQYQIRAVIREKTSGAVGSAYQFFEVPDVSNRRAVSLSSLLLYDPGKTEFDGANNFKRGAEMDVRYVAYNLPKEVADLTQRVRLLDAGGKVLLDSPLALAPTPPGADAAATNMAPQGTRLKLPPARGRYALVLNLQDKKGKVDVERRADFVIE